MQAPYNRRNLIAAAVGVFSREERIQALSGARISPRALVGVDQPGEPTRFALISLEGDEELANQDPRLCFIKYLSNGGLDIRVLVRDFELLP